LAGREPEAHFQYQQLQAITHYFYEDGTRLTAYADLERYAQEITAKLGVEAAPLRRFLHRSAEKYALTEQIFLQSSLHRWQSYLNWPTLRAIFNLPKLDLFSTMNTVNERSLPHPKLVQLFNRYATYNGSDPYQTPATLNIIPHLEHGIGAFFPRGGMHAITRSLFSLAQELGATFHLGQRVDQIEVATNGRARVAGVRVDGQFCPAQLVVSNMDVVNTYRHLLPQAQQPAKILDQPKSSSALIFYWGVARTFPELDLHNIFFSQNYREEFATIFQKRGIYHDPTVYVNITSKYEPGDAPPGAENWFVMINVPNNQGQNWDELIAQARQAIVAKLSRLLQTDLAPLIAAEAVLDPRSIEAKTSSSQGALYGNSSNNRYAAFLRHANFSTQIKNLYFCGGSVHPGGGIPLSLLSAKIVGDEVGLRWHRK
nr:phytoene desaturase family protein [Bernardetiaceae bacterium]